METVGTSSFPWRWFLALTVLLPCLYLPTLATRFDFIDDGCLVYPERGSSVGQHLQLIWSKTLAEFHHRGPFRPVTWAFWEAAADVLGDTALGHRLSRLLWAMVACASLVWLLYELGIRRWPLAFTAALAMWNPYRNEIWMALGLTEAFGMPFALAGLACAVRAARSNCSWRWDLAGMACLVPALGCKNTFAAVVPAQVLLRIIAGGLPWRQALRCHGPRAVMLSCTLVLPVTHYILFRLQDHPGQYAESFSWAQIGRMLKSVAGAASLELVGPCFVLVGLLCWLDNKRNPGPGYDAEGQARTDAWRTYRPAILTGLVLLTLGVGVYSRFGGAAGRYTIPAVWGVDLWLAVALMVLVERKAWRGPRLRTAALACLAGCLMLVAVVNVGKQGRQAARAGVLWQALEFVEQQAPCPSHVIWAGTSKVVYQKPPLGDGEGMHFQWHLHGRGRADIDVQYIDSQRLAAPETGASGAGNFLISGTPGEPAQHGWRLIKEFHSSYWLGWRSFHCFVWTGT